MKAQQRAESHFILTFLIYLRSGRLPLYASISSPPKDAQFHFLKDDDGLINNDG